MYYYLIIILINIKKSFLNINMNNNILFINKSKYIEIIINLH